MLEKTIKAVISKKIEYWLKSIQDERLQKELEEGVVVTGGAIVSLVQNEEPNDFDVYFRTKELAKEVGEYYCALWNKNHEDGPKASIIEEEDRLKIYIKSQGVGDEKDSFSEESFEIEEVLNLTKETNTKEIKKSSNKDKYRPNFITSNAISLSEDIQLVFRFWGEPDKIHETYDFVHCKGYWTSWNNKVNISKEVYEAIANKTLFYTGSKYPLCSLFRLRKFLKRGWHINAGQILKIAWQVSKLDFSDIDLLEDQLIGVDTLYFLELIENLRKEKEDDPNWIVNEEYITTLIDKVF